MGITVGCVGFSCVMGVACAASATRATNASRAGEFWRTMSLAAAGLAAFALAALGAAVHAGVIAVAGNLAIAVAAVTAMILGEEADARGLRFGAALKGSEVAAPLAVLLAFRFYLEGVFGDGLSTATMLVELALGIGAVAFFAWVYADLHDVPAALAVTSLILLSVGFLSQLGFDAGSISTDILAWLRRATALGALVLVAAALAVVEDLGATRHALDGPMGPCLLFVAWISLLFSGAAHAALVCFSLVAAVSIIRPRGMLRLPVVAAVMIASIVMMCAFSSERGFAAVFADPWAEGFGTRSLLALAEAAPLVGTGAPLTLVYGVPDAESSFAVARVLSTFGWAGVLAVAASLGAVAVALLRHGHRGYAPHRGPAVFSGMVLAVAICSNLAELAHVFPVFALEVPLISAGPGHLLFWLLAGLVMICAASGETSPQVEPAGFLGEGA